MLSYEKQEIISTGLSDLADDLHNADAILLDEQQRVTYHGRLEKGGSDARLRLPVFECDEERVFIGFDHTTSVFTVNIWDIEYTLHLVGEDDQEELVRIANNITTKITAIDQRTASARAAQEIKNYGDYTLALARMNELNRERAGENIDMSNISAVRDLFNELYAKDLANDDTYAEEHKQLDEIEQKLNDLKFRMEEFVNTNEEEVEEEVGIETPYDTTKQIKSCIQAFQSPFNKIYNRSAVHNRITSALNGKVIQSVPTNGKVQSCVTFKNRSGQLKVSRYSKEYDITYDADLHELIYADGFGVANTLIIESDYIRACLYYIFLNEAADYWEVRYTDTDLQLEIDSLGILIMTCTADTDWNDFGDCFDWRNTSRWWHGEHVVETEDEEVVEELIKEVTEEVVDESLTYDSCETTVVDGGFDTYETIESSEFTESVESDELAESDEPFESSLESMSKGTHYVADDDYVFIKSKKRKDGKSNRYVRNIKDEEEMKKEAENAKKNMMKNPSEETNEEAGEKADEEAGEEEDEGVSRVSTFRTFVESFMKAI